MGFPINLINKEKRIFSELKYHKNEIKSTKITIIKFESQISIGSYYYLYSGDDAKYNVSCG